MKKNKVLALVLIMIMSVLVLTACGAKFTEITIDDLSAPLAVGETFQLSPAYIFDKELSEEKYAKEVEKLEVVYTSGNDAVVTVDSTGLVTATGKGNTVVKISVGEISAEVAITVYVPLTGINVTENVTLYVGESHEVEVHPIPAEADLSEVTYVSSEKIVTVDGNGKIEAVGKGEAVVTVTSGEFSKEITVVVKVAPESITLNKTEGQLYVGNTYQLEATVTPEDADDVTLVWSSSDESIATALDGVVTAHKIGSAVITVKIEGTDIEATYTLTVAKKPTSSGGNTGGTGTGNTGGDSGNTGGGGSTPPPTDGGGNPPADGGGGSGGPVDSGYGPPYDPNNPPENVEDYPDYPTD